MRLVINAQTVTKIYLADTITNFANPERGFNTTFNPTFPPSGTSVNIWEQDIASWTPQLNEAMAKSIRINNGITLHSMRYHLAMFRDKDLTQAFLDRLNEDFLRARNAGIKLIVRFVYGWIGQRPDAPKEIILRHIAQLKPYLEKNADVIAFVDDGFIGYWGEWHHSKNNLLDGKYGEQLAPDSREILDALFDAVPKSRMVSIRYPHVKSQYFHKTPIDTWTDFIPVPTFDEAFSGSNAARAGNHNDGLFSSESNTVFGPGEVIEKMKKRIASENLFVVQSGEMDYGFGRTKSSLNCSSNIAFLKQQHWSILNVDDGARSYDPANIPVGTMAIWVKEGCFYDIAMHLGYRLRLINATVPVSVKRKGNLVLNFNIINDGYASLFNPRILELVLRNTGTEKETHVILNNDPRRWKPDSTYTISVNWKVPPDFQKGNYELFLNLPDPDPAIYGRPEYNIRLANKNTWEEKTGYNSFLSIVKIKP